MKCSICGNENIAYGPFLDDCCLCYQCYNPQTFLSTFSMQHLVSFFKNICDDAVTELDKQVEKELDKIPELNLKIHNESTTPNPTK